ncbi:MAG: hypothetical protein M1600_03105, partial [Firmicutes bacterium]|nr:hypothetical protein [Bacillota bacterium]
LAQAMEIARFEQPKPKKSILSAQVFSYPVDLLTFLGLPRRGKPRKCPMNVGTSPTWPRTTPKNDPRRPKRV